MSARAVRGLRHGVAASALTALLIASAGCGGSAVSVTPGAVRDLSARVTDVRRAAIAHDADAARRALESLRRRVATLRTRGEISDERAAAVLAAATRLDAHLDLVTTTTVTTTTTTTGPPVVPTKPAKPEKPENPGQGKGHAED